MLWKIYVWVFAAINALSLVSFGYGASFSQLLGLSTLVLSVALNIAVFSYAYKKPIFSKQILTWIFKLNIGLIGVFLSFEFLAFLQEIVGAGINLPTSGLVSVFASFPSFPALYATYKMAYAKPKKGKNKSKRT